MKSVKPTSPPTSPQTTPPTPPPTSATKPFFLKSQHQLPKPTNGDGVKFTVSVTPLQPAKQFVTGRRSYKGENAFIEELVTSQLKSVKTMRNVERSGAVGDTAMTDFMVKNRGAGAGGRGKKLSPRQKMKAKKRARAMMEE